MRRVTGREIFPLVEILKRRDCFNLVYTDEHLKEQPQLSKTSGISFIGLYSPSPMFGLGGDEF